VNPRRISSSKGKFREVTREKGQPSQIRNTSIVQQSEDSFLLLPDAEHIPPEMLA
jgi:hypothetical protein